MNIVISSIVLFQFRSHGKKLTEKLAYLTCLCGVRRSLSKYRNAEIDKFRL